jgi:probable FeS assembly SUF system protein SufT
MQNIVSVALSRDCEATQIPSGMPATLARGTRVDITQNLGGSYTIRDIGGGGLFRIAEKDADALGLDRACALPGAEPVSAAGPVEEKAVWDVLRTCYDPEIPLNIVDLGLIYDLDLDRSPEGGSIINLKMTLTAPGCGMGGAIAGDAQEKLLRLPGVRSANVQIVWDPPWHPSLISEEGRKVLGLE